MISTLSEEQARQLARELHYALSYPGANGPITIVVPDDKPTKRRYLKAA